MKGDVMQNILVIGAGRFGEYVCRSMYEAGNQVTIIDKDEKKIIPLLGYVSSAQIGDSTNEMFMQTVGIGSYHICFVAIGDDFLSSLETTYLLKELGAKRVVSRATNASQEKFLLRNGADDVVFPERQVGKWTAIRFSSEAINDYIELQEGWAIFELAVPREWNNTAVGDLEVRNRHGINILGVKNGVINMNISPNTVLHQGETMLVLGKTDIIRKVFDLK